MNQAGRFDINLATAPRRNRRLYFFLLGALGAALGIVVILGLTFFAIYRTKGGALKTSSADLDDSTRLVQREDAKYSKDSQDAAKAYQAKIDLVNTLITRKTFSWIEVFSLLEESLPETSYILSLNPALTGNARMQLSLRVASSSIDELFQFYKNLKAQGFQKITITSESRKEDNALISEINFDYEKRVQTP